LPGKENASSCLARRLGDRRVVNDGVHGPHDSHGADRPATKGAVPMAKKSKKSKKGKKGKK
jgi:hypothetical protein